MTLLIMSMCMMAQSESNSYILTKQYVINKGYTISWNAYAYIPQGETMYNDYNFTAGVTYLIYAVSEDSDVKDVDIVLYTASGAEYIKDTSVDSNACVVFTPTYDIWLRVSVKNYKSLDTNNKSLCRYFLAYQ